MQSYRDAVLPSHLAHLLPFRFLLWNGLGDVGHDGGHVMRPAVWLPWNRDDRSDRRAEGTLNILNLRFGWQLC